MSRWTSNSSDEQASNSAVAIKERMNRLELGMGDRGVYQRRQGLVMQEPLPGVETAHELRGRRRDVSGLAQRRPGGSDPVLTAPELPGGGHVSPNAPHQEVVHFPHQAQRHGQRLQACKPVLQCDDVVAHLPQVGGASLDGGPGFVGEQLSKGRLCSLDPAGLHRLLAHEGPDQQVGIGQPPSFARKPPDGPVGGRKLKGEARVPRHRRRERRRNIGPVAAQAVHHSTVMLACSFRSGCHVIPH